MSRTKYKKPSLKNFRAIAEKFGGNVSAIAKSLGRSRTTVYQWIDADPRFKEVIDDFRGLVLDECFVTARVLARGIPKKDENGAIVGWEERPDSNMIRYLMSTLGRKEGFGENVDITSKGEKVNQVVIFELPDNGRKLTESKEN